MQCAFSTNRNRMNRMKYDMSMIMDEWMDECMDLFGLRYYFSSKIWQMAITLLEEIFSLL